MWSHRQAAGSRSQASFGYRVRTKSVALIRCQLGVAPVMPEAAEGDEQEDEDREKPRHCAVCKAELTHLCGTHRPTVPVVLDMLWEDMAAAFEFNRNFRAAGR